MDSDLQAILPQLKGAPGNILAALLFAGRPLGVQELACLTGWSGNHISLALGRLAELGLVENTSRYSGWRLSSSALPRLFQRLLQALLLLSKQQPVLLGELLEGLAEAEERGEKESRRDAETRRRGARRADGKPNPWGSQGDTAVGGKGGEGGVYFENGGPAGQRHGKPKRWGSPGDSCGYGAGGIGNGSAGNQRQAHGKPKRWGSPYRKPTPWGSQGRKPKSCGSRSLKVVVDSSSKRLDLNTTTTPNATPRAPAVETILAAAQALFGEQVFSPPGWKPDAGQLLGWIAAVYHRPGNLRHPARAVYTHLKRGDLPEPAYRRDPLRYLPAAFLEQAGLARQEAAELPGPAGGPGGEPAPCGASGEGEVPGGGEACPAPQESGGEAGAGEAQAPASSAGLRTPVWLPAPDEPAAPAVLADPVEPSGPAPPAAIPALRQRISLRCEYSAESAWQKAADLLRLEMRPETFTRYLLPARLVDYDPQEGLFSVAAPDEFTRDWLADRLSRMAARTLAGICGRTVQVRFILLREPVGPE